MVETDYKIEICENQPDLERRFPKYVRVNIKKSTYIADCLAHESIYHNVEVNGTLEEVKALKYKDICEIYKKETTRFYNMVNHDID